MTAEIPPAETTDPVPPADPSTGTVDPDNWHTEGATEAPVEGLLTGTPTTEPGHAKPANWHTESEPTT